MRFTLLSLALFVLPAFAQNDTTASNPTAIPAANATAAASLPACAITCAISSIPGSGCSLSNITCLCTNAVLQANFVGCQAKTCNASEYAIALAFGVAQCAADGHSLTLPANTTTATSAVPTAAPSSTSAAAATASTTSTKSAASVQASIAIGFSIVAAIGTILMV